jgi:hypothetical protein
MLMALVDTNTKVHAQKAFLKKNPVLYGIFLGDTQLKYGYNTPNVSNTSMLN